MRVEVQQYPGQDLMSSLLQRPLSFQILFSSNPRLSQNPYFSQIPNSNPYSSEKKKEQAQIQ